MKNSGGGGSIEVVCQHKGLEYIINLHQQTQQHHWGEYSVPVLSSTDAQAAISLIPLDIQQDSWKLLNETVIWS